MTNRLMVPILLLLASNGGSRGGRPREAVASSRKLRLFVKRSYSHPRRLDKRDLERPRHTMKERCGRDLSALSYAELHAEPTAGPLCEREDSSMARCAASNGNREIST